MSVTVTVNVFASARVQIAYHVCIYVCVFEYVICVYCVYKFVNSYEYISIYIDILEKEKVKLIDERQRVVGRKFDSNTSFHHAPACTRRCTWTYCLRALLSRVCY